MRPPSFVVALLLRSLHFIIFHRILSWCGGGVLTSSRELNRYMAVDLGGDPWLLEVNASPDFRAATREHGTDAAIATARYRPPPKLELEL